MPTKKIPCIRPRFLCFLLTAALALCVISGRASARFYIDTASGDTDEKAVSIDVPRACGQKISNNALVKGSSPPSPIAATLESIWQAMGEKMADLMAWLENIPETDEYQALKDTMAELEDKIKDSGGKMGKTIQNDILPLLEEKISALAEKLRQQGQEDKAKFLEKDLKQLQDI